MCISIIIFDGKNLFTLARHQVSCHGNWSFRALLLDCYLFFFWDGVKPQVLQLHLKAITILHSRNIMITLRQKVRSQCEITFCWANFPSGRCEWGAALCQSRTQLFSAIQWLCDTNPHTGPGGIDEFWWRSIQQHWLCYSHFAPTMQASKWSNNRHMLIIWSEQLSSIWKHLVMITGQSHTVLLKRNLKLMSAQLKKNPFTPFPPASSQFIIMVSWLQSAKLCTLRVNYTGEKARSLFLRWCKRGLQLFHHLGSDCLSSQLIVFVHVLSFCQPHRHLCQREGSRLCFLSDVWDRHISECIAQV